MKCNTRPIILVTLLVGTLSIAGCTKDQTKVETEDQQDEVVIDNEQGTDGTVTQDVTPEGSPAPTIPQPDTTQPPPDDGE